MVFSFFLLKRVAILRIRASRFEFCFVACPYRKTATHVARTMPGRLYPGILAAK